MKEYRVVVIGGGAGGIVTAMGAAGMGMSVALIEQQKIGGECSWSGCVPSKALLAAAKEVYRVQQAEKWGIRVTGEIHVSGVLEKVRELTQRTADRSATVKQLEAAGVKIYIGTPRFITSQEIDIDGTRIRGKDIVLATGSSPSRPTGIGLEETPYITNQEIFNLQEIPSSLGILGGGPIGIEMAQAFQRLGSKVTVFQRGAHILPKDDKELADELTKIMVQEGVAIHLQTKVYKVNKIGEEIQVAARDCKGASFLTNVEVLLVAAGRDANNVKGLDLEKIGVEYNEKGIKVDRYLRTTVPHIWACGDCIGEYQFAHMAEVEGRIVLQNILLPLSQSPDYAGVPWATFTEPELAHLGLTEEEATKQGIEYEVYCQPFSLIDRAIVEQADEGLIKLIVRPNGQILGAHILGSGAGELINELMVAKHGGIGLRTLSSLPHIYPSWGYGIQRGIDHWLIAVSKRWYARLAFKFIRGFLS